MGIYSVNRLVSEDYYLPAIKGYDDGYYSAQQAMLESKQNEMVLFEAIIMSDMEEAYMEHCGVDSYEIQAFTENVLTDVLDKIKEFLTKVWQKIKAIFEGWMAKIDSVMIKSNKEFVNKYKDTVLKKDLTDMEVKWRKLKAGKSIADLAPFGTDDLVTEQLDTSKHKDPQGTLDKWDEEDELVKILKKAGVANLSDSKDYEKDFIDEYLEDEDTDDKVDIHTVMSELISFKDTKRGQDKALKSLNKAISHMVKTIEKDQSDFSKLNPTTMKWGEKDQSDTYTFDTYNGTKELFHKQYSYKNTTNDEYESTRKEITGSDKNLLKGTSSGGKDKWDEKNNPVKNYQKSLNLVYKYAMLHQKAANMYTAAVMKLFKIYNSENRKAWAKAVAYSRKEEAVMTEALMELAEYDAY